MSYIDIKYLNLIAYRLRNFKPKPNGLFNFSCPFCGDSQRNLKKARGYVYQKGGKYFFKCHNCNCGVHISKLLEHVDPEVYANYKVETFLDNSPEIKPTKPVIPIKFAKISKVEYNNMMRCDLLKTTHPCYQYLKARRIPDRRFEKLWYTDNFKELCQEVFPGNLGLPGIDENPRLVIPFYNTYDELKALSGRALNTHHQRYLTIREASETPLVYGLDGINKSEPIRVVEGPLDSLFLNNCIASGDANLLSTLKVIDEPIFIYDNEPRNKEIVRLMRSTIDGGHRIVIWPSKVDGRGKDVNEMILSGLTEGTLESIIRLNTYSSMVALLKFNQWRKV